MEANKTFDELGGYESSLAEGIQEEEEILHIVEDKRRGLQKREESVDDFCPSFAPELSIPGVRLLCRRI